MGREAPPWWTILSQGLYCVLLLWYCRDTIEWRGEDARRFLGMLASVALMGIVLAVLPYMWYWEVLIGAVLYAVSLPMFGGVARQDIEIIRSIRKE